MAVIGTLVAKLNMDSRDFTRGSQKAQSGMGKLQSSVTKLAGAFKLMGAAAAAAAAYGFTQLIRGSFETIDSLAKASDKLGITTEKLANLRSVATLTGVSIGNLESGIQRLVRGISEAVTGIGTAKPALEELGLVAEEMNRLSPDEQFFRVAKAMENVKLQGDKVRLTYQLFGRSGVDLVNTLNLGSEAIENNELRLRRLGVAVSRIDAAKIEQANDAYFRMSEAIQGVANSFAISFSPAISATLDLIASRIERISNAFSSMLGLLDAASLIANPLNPIDLMLDFAIKKQKQAKQNQRLSQVSESTTHQQTGKSFDIIGRASSFASILANNISEEITKATAKAKLKEVIGGASEFREFSVNSFKQFKRFLTGSLGGSQVASEIQSSFRDTSAKVKGSREAFSAILSNRNDQEKQIAMNTKKSADNLSDIVNKIAELIDINKSEPSVKVASIGVGS